jgi:GTP-binding protein
MDVNPTREKKLTNMRSSTADMTEMLTPPTTLSLEQALEFIRDDESVEVTPKSIRLRKKSLDPHARYKAERDKKKSEAAAS